MTFCRMTTTLSDTGNLASSLKTCIQRQLTGRLDIECPGQDSWCFHFFMGRLVRAEGGIHPIRRWRRHLSQHCPQFNLDNDAPLDPSELLHFEKWDYYALIELVERQQIPREQAIKTIEASLVEALFDILQQEELSRINLLGPLRYRIVGTNPQTVITSPLLPAGIKYLWQQAQQQWQAWKKSGFATRSPNLAPVVQSPQQLRSHAQQSRGLRVLLKVMNGSRTLRDLAIKLGHSPLLLLKFLTPYLGRGVIELVSLNDLDFALADNMEPVTQVLNTPLPAIPQRTEPQATVPTLMGPLIAYIEDSPLYRQVMGELLAESGYQFVGIQDPLQTVPTLLEHKPDLIFLDLVMPIANGYEICAQIRRISTLKDIPVVIVTSSDTFVDRVRAKIVGASDFLPKPIRPQKVLGMLKKHLGKLPSDP
ncbi:MAG: response regulator [Cyanobacteria bacterium P01_D01_bin.44]